jgi:hypothetical protein
LIFDDWSFSGAWKVGAWSFPFQSQGTEISNYGWFALVKLRRQA